MVAIDHIVKKIAPYLSDITVKYQEWLGDHIVYKIESDHYSHIDRVQTMIVCSDHHTIYFSDSWVSDPVLKEGKILAFAGSVNRYYGRYGDSRVAKFNDFDNSMDHLKLIPIIYGRPVFEARIKRELSMKQELGHWLLKKAIGHKASMLENRVIWGNSITSYSRFEQFPGVTVDGKYTDILNYYSTSQSRS